MDNCEMSMKVLFPFLKLPSVTIPNNGAGIVFYDEYKLTEKYVLAISGTTRTNKITL